MPLGEYKHYYSVHYRHIGKKVTILYTSALVVDHRYEPL